MNTQPTICLRSVKKKIWHVFGGCKRASPHIWKHLPQTAGLGVVMETTLEPGYDTELWFKSLLWNACVKNLPWGWPRQGGVLRGKAGTLCPRELGGCLPNLLICRYFSPSVCSVWCLALQEVVGLRLTMQTCFAVTLHRQLLMPTD